MNHYAKYLLAQSFSFTIVFSDTSKHTRTQQTIRSTRPQKCSVKNSIVSPLQLREYSQVTSLLHTDKRCRICVDYAKQPVDSIDSPLLSSIAPHSFIPGLNLPFLHNLSTAAYLFFFRTDSTDSPDCLPILLIISVYIWIKIYFRVWICRRISRFLSSFFLKENRCG